MKLTSSKGKGTAADLEASDPRRVLFYEARSTLTGPCGHKHNTKEAAEKCARSFASAYHRKNPFNTHTYWHVASVDGYGVRKRVSEDL